MGEGLESPKLFIAETEGTFVSPLRNEDFKSYGWDSVFMPKNYSKTYA